MAQGGDHVWNQMQTAPNSMRPNNPGMAHIKNDPGLQTVAGGMYSYRPRTPTRPTATATTSNLHLRKTNVSTEEPNSYIVMTRSASPRTARIQTPGSSTTRSQIDNPSTNTGTHRISVEHYINIMRDSVHRLGARADPIVDQLCFTSRRAQLDALFKLCPSIDFVDAGKVISYLMSHTGEIEHLRSLAKGHSAIPADHIREPSRVQAAQSNHVTKKNNMRQNSSLPNVMSNTNQSGIPGIGGNELQGKQAVNAGTTGPRAKPGSVRYRPEEAHARTHAPVLEYGKSARARVKTDVQTIFEDLEKQNTQVVGIGRHTSRPEYMDTKPDWSLISRSSPMSHSEADRFKTLANNSLPSHMRPTFKYMHPSTIGQTNNYTKLRNFKKFHTDIQRTMQDAAKAKNSGRNALHKPEVQYLGGSRRSARTFES